MPHLTQEDLVLLYYGEACAPSVPEHLAECAECRAEYQALQRLLNSMDAAPLPERGPEYGTWVWERVRARQQARAAATFGWRWLAAAAALLLIFGVWKWTRADYSIGPRQAETTVAGQDELLKERVLEAALESHLESSRVMLTEIMNEDVSEDTWARDVAADLLADNRLYRQTARASGWAETERLLTDLEELLVEVAHSPAPRMDLRERIDAKGVLLAIQVRTAY
jgi:predicted anti-sigma-YlaC factor YlaD